MVLFLIAIIGNLNVDQKAKGTVTVDYDMCVDLMLMIKNGNSNAVSGGCGLSGGWIPYGGKSGIYNSAATSAGVVSISHEHRTIVLAIRLNADFVQFQGICVLV